MHLVQRRISDESLIRESSTRRTFLTNTVGDTNPRQGHQFSQWRVRSARPARQRRDEIRHRSVVMTIWRAQINRISRAAGRAAHPEIPIVRSYHGADRRREQHGHPLGLALVPGGDEILGVLKHLGIGRAPGRGLTLGSLPALVLHLAAVEAHGRSVAERARVSMSALPPKAAAAGEENPLGRSPGDLALMGIFGISTVGLLVWGIWLLKFLDHFTQQTG